MSDWVSLQIGEANFLFFIMWDYATMTHMLHLYKLII